MTTLMGEKRASLLRGFLRISACLFLVSLVVTGQVDKAAAAECTRRGQTAAAVPLVDSPPIYNTNSGWVYGKPTGVIVPKDAEIRICEERVVGFPPATQRWVRIRWESKSGWVYGGTVRELAANLMYLVAAPFILETALAHSPGNDTGAGEQAPLLPDPKSVIGVALLVGMASKNALDYYKLQDRPTTVRFFGRMMPALVISPYPFHVVVGNLNILTQTGMIGLFAFAFETGFFFQDVASLPLEKLRAGSSRGLNQRPNIASRAHRPASRRSPNRTAHE